MQHKQQEKEQKLAQKASPAHDPKKTVIQAALERAKMRRISSQR
jgi:hypothetical protein